MASGRVIGAQNKPARKIGAATGSQRKVSGTPASMPQYAAGSPRALTQQKDLASVTAPIGSTNPGTPGTGSDKSVQVAQKTTGPTYAPGSPRAQTQTAVEGKMSQPFVPRSRAAGPKPQYAPSSPRAQSIAIAEGREPQQFVPRSRSYGPKPQYAPTSPRARSLARQGRRRQPRKRVLPFDFVDAGVKTASTILGTYRAIWAQRTIFAVVITYFPLHLFLLLSIFTFLAIESVPLLGYVFPGETMAYVVGLIDMSYSALLVLFAAFLFIGFRVDAFSGISGVIFCVTAVLTLVPLINLIPWILIWVFTAPYINRLSTKGLSDALSF